MTIGLLICAILVLMFSHYSNKKDIIAPSFIFSAGLTFAIVWAVSFASKWDLDVRGDTFIVIIGGMLCFSVTSFLVSRAYNFKTSMCGENTKQNVEYIPISFWWKIICIIIEVATISLTVFYIIRLTGGSLASWSLAIASYKYRYVQDSSFSIPGYVARLRTFVNAMGYWYCVVLVNNWFSTRKIEKLPAFIFILSIVSGVVVGSRGWGVNLLLALLVCVVIYLNKTSGFYKSVRFITIFKIVLILVFALVAYQFLGSFLGIDTSKIDPVEYIAMYCGAEIKNLDIFMQKRNVNPALVGKQTFIYIVKGFQYRMGNSDFVALDMPFNRVNGYELGNVYTTFYPFVYDFGIIGVFFLTPLMSLIVQTCYEYVRHKMFSNKPLMSIVLYSYFFSSIVFAFFSNKFYETVFTETFLWHLLFWFIFSWLFCGTKLILKWK